MKRNRIENEMLKYNIRVNGPIWAAFKNERQCKDTALALMRGNPKLNVEMTTQDGTTYSLVSEAEQS